MNITAKGTVTLDDGQTRDVEVRGVVLDNGYLSRGNFYGGESFEEWKAIQWKHQDQLKAILQAEYNRRGDES